MLWGGRSQAFDLASALIRAMVTRHRALRF